MGSIGMPEIIVVLMIVAASLVPWVLAVWALVTILRVRDRQRAIEAKLDKIAERLSQ
jgi:hypothetical protein